MLPQPGCWGGGDGRVGAAARAGEQTGVKGEEIGKRNKPQPHPPSRSGEAWKQPGLWGRSSAGRRSQKAPNEREGRMLRVSQENPQAKRCRCPARQPWGVGFSSLGCWAVLSSPWGFDSAALARIISSLLWCCYGLCFQLQSEENNFSGIHRAVVQINVCRALGCHSDELHSNPARK